MSDSSTQPWRLVEQEIAELLNRIEPSQFESLVQAFSDKDGRWFFSGQGRSGLIAQMIAMRLMHAGYQVCVVGEVSAPAIRQNDWLVLVCGSGQTPVSVAFAKIAKDAGAKLVLVTHKPESELAKVADVLLTVPMSKTVQFGGTLFEQVSLILLDALCFRLSPGQEAHAAMWMRHTNMQ